MGLGGPSRRRQASRTGTRGPRRLSPGDRRQRRRPRVPPLHRGLGDRRCRPGWRRSGRRALILILRAQVLPRREPPERPHPGWQLERLNPGVLSLGLRGKRRVLAGTRVITEELARREPAEHPCLLPPTRRRSALGGLRPPGSSCGRRHRSPSRRPRPSAGLGRLGIQLDVPLGPDDAEALLQVVVEPQLGHDARDDAQARGERELIHRRHVEGARHRHLQAPPVHREREHEVLLGQRRGDRAERGRGHSLELRDGRLRVARLLRQHRTQRLDVQVVQLDEVRPEPAPVDHLGLQGFVELTWIDEALADQERTELFRHEEADSRRLR